MYPEMRWSWENKSIFKLLPCGLVGIRCLQWRGDVFYIYVVFVEKMINIALEDQGNTTDQVETNKCNELSDLIDKLNVLLQKFEGRRSTTYEDQTRLGRYRSKRRKVSFQQI